MQLIKQQVIDLLGQAILDNKDNEELVNKLNAAVKLIGLF